MNEKHIEEAVKLAVSQYKEECEKVDSLVTADFSDRIRKAITALVKKETGVVALEEGKVIGFIVGYGPIDRFFGKDSGLYIPVECHGAIKERRLEIYGKLFREAATYWASKGWFSLGISHYVHDEELKDWLFINGFGARCMDAMSNIDDLLSRLKEQTLPDNITIQPKVETDLPRIFEMTNELVDHLRTSPVFFPLLDDEYDEFLEDINESEAVYLVAKDGDKIIGHIKFIHDGEECFASYHGSISNICGAYLQPEYRGAGIFQQLLVEALKVMQEKGKTRCGVDCETINPEAFAFWTKYFTPYTYSVNRRIDERSVVKEHNIIIEENLSVKAQS